MLKFLRANRSVLIVWFAFALPLAGCTAMQTRLGDLHLGPPPITQGPGPADYWWLAAGDPVLARLVTRSLSGSASLACEAAALVPRQGHGIAGLRRARVATADAGYRYADHRARFAAAIAHAYVDVRKWQSLAELRSGVLDQYRDNAEIAHFRHEAGLVSTIDGGLAGALSAQNNDAHERTSVRLAAELAALSNLAGIPSADLELGDSTAVPDLAPPAFANPPDLSARADLLALKSRLERRLLQQKVSQANLDQAVADPGSASTASPAQGAVADWRHAFIRAGSEISALAAVNAEADAQLVTLTRRQAAAQRAVADARLAYRAGVGSFATLFVAEVAALGLREALVEAQADRAAAIIDLRTALGQGWSPADLSPAAIAAAAARKGADCE